MYIGEVGKRYDLELKLVGEYSFVSYFGYKEIETCIYKMEDSEGNVFVWKTSSLLGMDKEDSRGNCFLDTVKRGDTAKIKATVKEHSEYKGTEQTVLSRVKVVSISHVPTKYEIAESKKIEQIKSLKEGDFIWNMPYRQYKEHYADCETLANSYVYEDATIGVIIRKGRLVNSGVRGKHFSGYQFTVDGAYVCCYRAVSEENAEKRCRADFPNAVSVVCSRIYR